RGVHRGAAQARGGGAGRRAPADAGRPPAGALAPDRRPHRLRPGVPDGRAGAHRFRDRALERARPRPRPPRVARDAGGAERAAAQAELSERLGFEAPRSTYPGAAFLTPKTRYARRERGSSSSSVGVAARCTRRFLAPAGAAFFARALNCSAW